MTTPTSATAPQPSTTCTTCGAPLNPGTTVCTACGATVGEATAVAPAPASTSPYAATDAYGSTGYGATPSAADPYAGQPYAQQPYDQTSYAQAPYGQPQPMAPQPQFYAQPPTNTLAIVALVLGLVTGIGGIICGHISLSQIKRTGEGGRGMALAGLIIGYVFTGFWVLYIIFAVVIVAIFANTANSYDYGLVLQSLQPFV